MKVAPYRLTRLINKACLGQRNLSYSIALSAPARQTQAPRKAGDPTSQWPVEVLLKEAIRSGNLPISVQTAIQILKDFRAQGSPSAEQICSSQ